MTEKKTAAAAATRGTAFTVCPSAVAAADRIGSAVLMTAPNHSIERGPTHNGSRMALIEPTCEER